MSLLNDTIIKQDLLTALREYFEFNDTDSVTPSILWEGSKVVMRGKLIAISSKLKRQRIAIQNELEKQIHETELAFQNTQDTKLLASLKENRQKLDDLLTYKAEGALRFLNRKYYEYGNKASRLLAFQLRKAQSNRVVNKIKNTRTNQMLTQPGEIAREFATYYQKLYEKEQFPGKEEKIETFLKS